MSLISLKNVSKFYYSKGVIASGFTKVNLDLNDGEFVAITGESGSGKSTLLNVISGLDSYEEGEMYINGLETSHYTEKDFEDYRRKYIGNIFQSFNLVNSYTVYQNIELVLLLNGNKKKDVKKNVLELIKKVGLYKFRNQKVSKLSGGQKQRVAIARALAKETPIIIADEPTGNLDSKSATEILKLLSEIAKDKLVIVVTHNYEQIEKYVTRKITMSDGRIIEDKSFNKVDKKDDIRTSNYKNITSLNKLRLGIRNAFNIKVKFLLLLFVYFFVIFALSVEYTSFKDEEYNIKKSGVNEYFVDSSDKRVVLTKKDGSPFEEADYLALEKMENINKITKEDQLVDRDGVSFIDNTYIYMYGHARNINDFDGKLSYGRMPENENEIIIDVNGQSGINENNYEQYFETDFYLEKSFYENTMKNREIYKIVGVRFLNKNDDDTFYVSEKVLKYKYGELLYQLSDINLMINNTKYSINNLGYGIVPLDKIKEGTIVVSQDLNQYCKYSNCYGKEIKFDIENRYYKDSLSLKVSGVYSNKYSYKRLTGLDEYNDYIFEVFMNPNDYNKLFNRNYYQTSVYVNDIDLIDETISNLNNLGYKTFALKDALYVADSVEIIQIFKVIVMTILIVVLFVITYFVTKIIVKSRKVYFSTIRMLGATKKICKRLLSIELVIISNISYLIFITLLVLTAFGYINLGIFKTVNDYLNIREYILLYLIINLMSYLISLKYSKEVFKNSAISTLKEDN